MQVKYKSEKKKCCVKAICNKKYNCCCLKFFISETLAVAFWGFCDLNWTHSLSNCSTLRRLNSDSNKCTLRFFLAKTIDFSNILSYLLFKTKQLSFVRKKMKKAERMKKQKQLRILHLQSFVVIFTKVNIYFASFFCALNLRSSHNRFITAKTSVDGNALMITN